MQHAAQPQTTSPRRASRQAAGRARMARQPRQTGPDYNRMMIRFEEGIAGVTERLEQIADNFDQRMSRIEHDIGSGREERRTILNELADARIDNGELRDIANRLKQQVVETGASQVKEAAAGAAEGAATVAAKTAVAAPGSKTWRYVITVLAGIAAVSGVAQGLPHIVKFLSTIWKALEGLAK